MKATAFIFCFLCINFFTQAQVILVQDICPGPGVSRSSDPQFITPFGSKLCFNAYDTGYGRELWSYNDTIATMVKDIRPGTNDGCYNANDHLHTYAVYGTKMYFSGNDGTHGDELFMYDGVNPPTMVADINPGATSSSPNNYLTSGNKVYLIAYDAVYHYQLFVFDPFTSIATRKTSLPNEVYSGAGTSMTVYRGKLYFTGNDGITGNESYVYDLTSGSSSLFADIRPGAPSSSPNNYIVGNDTLYFSAQTSTGTEQIFKYTGIDTPVQITSLGTGFNGFSGHLIYFKNMLVFSGDNADGKGVELYKYDISTKTTSLVSDIYPGSSGSNPNNFCIYGSKLYFAANDGVHGSELWAWDGTNTPYMFADIDSGGATSNSNPQGLIIWNGSLYMNATNTTAGTELFKYTDTTLSVVNIRSGIDVKVYPVPSSGVTNIQLNLKTATRISVQVYDINGKQMYITNMQDYVVGDHTIPIDMSIWRPGNYYYRLVSNTNKTLAAGRLMKE